MVLLAKCIKDQIFLIQKKRLYIFENISQINSKCSENILKYMYTIKKENN